MTDLMKRWESPDFSDHLTGVLDGDGQPTTSTFREEMAALAGNLHDDANFLRLLASSYQGGQHRESRTLLVISGPSGSVWSAGLAAFYAKIFQGIWGLEVRPFQPNARQRRLVERPHEDRTLHILELDGYSARALAGLEEGTHLAELGRGLSPIQVIAWRCHQGEAVPEALKRLWADADEASENEAAVASPFRLQPILRLYHEGGAVFDLQSGYYFAQGWDAEELATCVAARLAVTLETPEETEA